MIRRSPDWPRWLLLVGVAAAATGCRSTEDYLGYDRTDGMAPIACPTPYRGAYVERLGRTQEQVDAKLENAFNQLFYGNADEQAIYFTMGSQQGFIRDVLHGGEVRSEGMGLGMVICAMLDKRSEFDRLWRYAVAQMSYTSGPLNGYFRSRCDTVQFVPLLQAGESRECADPYGLQQFAMALLLARQRWPSSADSPDYGAEAKRLLELLRGNKTAIGVNGSGGATSIVGGNGSGGSPSVAGANAVASSGAGGTSTAGATNVVATFDALTKLVFDEPALNPIRQTGTALEIPAYYDVWAQVTGDPFFTDAAVAARRFLAGVAHPVTGLVPVRASFTGTPVPGWGDFSAEAYRTLLNLVIDRAWGNSDPWQTAQINRALGFFSAEGLTTYGAAYSLDGSAKPVPDHFPELVYVNGALAALSTNADRRAYLQAAWDEPVPSGSSRYYRGLMYLMSNLLLGGRFQLCR